MGIDHSEHSEVTERHGKTLGLTSPRARKKRSAMRTQQFTPRQPLCRRCSAPSFRVEDRWSLREWRLFGSRADFRLPALGGRREARFRQWDELGLVAGHLAEASGLPILLRLLDPFARRGDEIPEQVARPIHRRPA